ncbi:MAG TPA: hypothetical protein VFC15_11520 [Candidatus Limnocylindrales bacterium]|nr:hypothetical protein [Candidatus Limnocylindrales bacterium]
MYTPVLAKHSKHFSLEDSLAIGVDRMQRNFGPLKQQVEEWQALQLSTASAKLLIYQAFIEEESGFPKHLARRVHDLYFEPVHEEFQPRTMWSLSNAFTSAFKELERRDAEAAESKNYGARREVCNLPRSLHGLQRDCARPHRAQGHGRCLARRPSGEYPGSLHALLFRVLRPSQQ